MEATGRRRLLTGVLLAALLAAITLTSCSLTGPGRVVARVNDRSITKAELDQRIRLLKFIYGPEAAADLSRRDAPRRVLAMMAEEELLLDEASSRGVKAEQGKVAEQRQALIGFLEEREGSAADLDLALNQVGLDRSDLGEYSRRLITLEGLYQGITAEVKVGPAEVEAYYHGHRQEFQLPEVVKARRLVVTVRRDADAVRAQLLKGGNFQRLAVQRDVTSLAGGGGDLGYVVRGQLPPGEEKVLFALQPGEVSRVTAVKDGFAIFTVEEKVPAQQLTLEQARPAVEERSLIDKQAKVFDNFVAQLRENSDIFMDPTRLAS